MPRRWFLQSTQYDIPRFIPGCIYYIITWTTKQFTCVDIVNYRNRAACKSWKSSEQRWSIVEDYKAYYVSGSWIDDLIIPAGYSSCLREVGCQVYSDWGWHHGKSQNKLLLISTSVRRLLVMAPCCHQKSPYKLSIQCQTTTKAWGNEASICSGIHEAGS